MPQFFRCLLFGVIFPLALARGAELTEFHVRGGLPNVAAKIARGEEVRVAFLGGSITAAAGWRPMTLTTFQRAYPKTKFTEINAAVSGTGSDYGAPRLQRDVLRHRPDLLFVEFAVNDGSGSPRVEARMEGIVRQTWAANPHTDICFVYTVSDGMLKDLLAGSYQSTARSMENVAAHYAIPSFNFGVEIARRIAAATLVMTAPESVKADAEGRDAQGRLIFTRDKTHPTDAGHCVYADRLALALPQFLRAGAADRTRWRNRSRPKIGNARGSSASPRRTTTANGNRFRRMMCTSPPKAGKTWCRRRGSRWSRARRLRFVSKAPRWASSV
jgi:lysophospholipase L1-like esterase